MLAPLPPEGMLFIGPRLFATEPDVWLETVSILSGSDAPLLERTRRVIFSNRFSQERVSRHLSLMSWEGSRVLFDAHEPNAEHVAQHLLGWIDGKAT